jgi:hypothetical protein
MSIQTPCEHEVQYLRYEIRLLKRREHIFGPYQLEFRQGGRDNLGRIIGPNSSLVKGDVLM